MASDKAISVRVNSVATLCGYVVLARVALGLWSALTQKVERLARKRREGAKIEPRRTLLAKRVAAAKRRLEKLQDEVPLTDAFKKEILHTPAVQLAARMREGKLKCVEVLRVFAERVIEVHALTNCLTEITFIDSIPFGNEDIEPATDKARSLLTQGRGEGAFAVAERLDKLPLSERKGSLFGVPVSLKDCFGVAGTDGAIGEAGLSGKVAGADSAVVGLLREQGAVVLVKTAVPQAMLSYECESPIHGLTVHPVNPKYTPGGSSGGESALLNAGGSVIGVGTDIGGSIRMPCHFCGLYGLKASFGRVPADGVRSGIPGQEAVPGSAGPMTRYMEDCVEMSRVLLSHYQARDGLGQGAFNIDARCVPMPWNERLYEQTRTKQRLRIGYYTHDGFLAASPACTRAVNEAVEALRRAGHECVEWTPPDMTKLVPLYAALLSADGARTLNKSAVQAPGLAALVTKTQVPVLVKRFGAWLLRTLFQSPIMAQLTRGMAERRVDELYAGQKERADARTDAQQMFVRDELDAVIAPCMPTPAPPHRSFLKAPFGANYTGTWNLLDWCGVSVPITVVKPELDSDISRLKVVDAFCHAQIYGGKVGGILPGQKTYDAVAMKGLPVGVQVLAPRLQEERVLGAAVVLDAALGTRDRGLAYP
eukprot:Hpha_TRINITY_DN14881_c0_g4::TRINITY_DN14881_c0_g4_i1::g.169508::m.169508